MAVRHNPGSAASLGAPRVLAQSAVAVSHTGDTAETALATITVPPGAMGPNGALRIVTLWSYTNSANAKTLKVRHGGIGGTTFATVAVTTTATYRVFTQIQNRGAENAQVGHFHNQGSGWGSSTGALSVGTKDTADAQDLVITGQLANAGETVTLEAYLVEVMYGP